MRTTFFLLLISACTPPIELILRPVNLTQGPTIKSIEFVGETVGDGCGKTFSGRQDIVAELPFVAPVQIPNDALNCSVQLETRLFVDAVEVGRASASLSPGQKEATLLFTLCSNGALEEQEACDDANLTDGDGCDSTCKKTGCASGVSTPGELCFFENDNLVGPAGPLQVLSEDVNGDGQPDLIAPYAASDLFGTPEAVRVFLNDGGTFESSQPITLPGIKRLTLGDIDADGDPDIIGTVKQPSLAPQVVVLLNEEGEFSLTQQSFLSAQDAGVLALGSLNGDQFPDLVYLDPAANTLNVLLATPKGGFGNQQQSFAVGAGPVALALADLDNNGKLDAVTANASGSVSVLLNDGASFVANPPLSVGGVPSALVLGDFDTTPGLDLAVVKQDNTGGNLLVFQGNEDGDFQPFGVFDAPLTLSALIAADLDLDGDLDLAFTSQIDSVIAVQFNDGNGQFDSPPDVTGGIFDTRQGPISLSVSDLNGDGVPDLVAAGKNLGVLLSNP